MVNASADRIVTERHVNSPLDCCKEIGIPIICQGFCPFKKDRSLESRLESGAVVESISNGQCVKHRSGIMACRNDSKYAAVNRISIFSKDFFVIPVLFGIHYIYVSI